MKYLQICIFLQVIVHAVKNLSMKVKLFVCSIL